MDNNPSNKLTSSASALKFKSSGNPYVTRLEMIQKYRESILPYPFAAIFKLDYCYNIVKAHAKFQLSMSLPLTLLLGYVLNPQVRTIGMKARPFSYYLSLYILTYSALTSFCVLDALLTCDYCKPWSAVYSMESNSDYFRKILKSRIKSEQSKQDFKMKKTAEQGLSDDEL